MKCSSVSLFMAFVLKSICVLQVLLPQLFSPVCLHEIFFFQPFTFSLYRSFVLRWASCRQHMCRSCILIHSATLCLLIGAFKPFIFNVIIDRYLFIAFFPFCTYFLLSLTLFLHLLKAVSLAYLTMLVWWTCILLAFVCLGNSLFHLPF